MPQAKDWDAVDQAGFDSFPASDPPAWGSSRAAPSCASISHTVASPPARTESRFAGAMRVVRIGMTVLAAYRFVKRLRRRPA